MSVWESVRAIRFRSAPRLPEVFLLPPAHPSAVSVESDARHAVLMALPHFPVVQPRALQCHLTKRCSPHLLMPWLLRSSESVPPRVQHGQERSKRRFAKNGQWHDTNCTNYHESRRPHSWRIKLVTDKSGAGRVVEGLATAEKRRQAAALQSALSREKPSCEFAKFVFHFDSAFVAMPTLVIPARCTESISAINFCTGNSRSGRITMAISGFAALNSVNRAVSVAKSSI